jgi:hypothetical protein
MLARRSTLTHSHAGDSDLPLLVPAFSSKGFEFDIAGKGKTKREFSMLAYELADFGKYPCRSVLVSAYDLHFKHFQAPEFPRTPAESHLRKACLVFLDSGGYELSPDFDLTELRVFGYKPKDGYWEDQYERVLKRLARSKRPPPLVIANFDRASIRQPLESQITAARTLFNRYPDYLGDFIIKPWLQDSKVVDPAKLSDDDVKQLRGFHIIGVTEKDLGTNLIDRVKRVATLRKKLDEAEIAAPIHLWGGLDPISSPLFFFTGAEIFDGVGWLRYAYHEGVAVYRGNYTVMKQPGVTASRQMNHAYASLDNRSAMEELESALQQWVDFEGESFDMFNENIRDHLAKAYKVMRSKIPELKGS